MAARAPNSGATSEQMTAARAETWAETSAEAGCMEASGARTETLARLHSCQALDVLHVLVSKAGLPAVEALVSEHHENDHDLPSCQAPNMHPAG